MAASTNNHIPGKHNLEFIRDKEGRDQLWTKEQERVAPASISTYCHRYMACRRLRLPSCGLNLDPEGKHADAVTISTNTQPHVPVTSHRDPPRRQQWLFCVLREPRSDVIPTHSSFASVPPLWSVHLVVVVVVEGVLGCVCLQNSLQQRAAH